MTMEDDRVEFMNLTTQSEDRLATWWNIGIGTAYAFLIFFILWVGYRTLLIFNAYRAGDFGFIQAELLGYAAICAIYFGTGYVLRYLEII